MINLVLCFFRSGDLQAALWMRLCEKKYFFQAKLTIGKLVQRIGDLCPAVYDLNFVQSVRVFVINVDAEKKNKRISFSWNKDQTMPVN